jgi:RNA polymerase sigma-70 factor, ECF subfamily
MSAGKTQNKSLLAEKSDEELIALFQNENEEAFNILVGRFKDPLMNFVFRFLNNYDECDDIVQETFVRVYLHKKSYKPLAKFSTWIYTIAGNLAKSRFHQRKNILSFLKTDGSKDRYDIPDIGYNLDEITDSVLLERLIQDALMRIPPAYRQAVILRDMQELSYDEITKILNTGIGTVKSRINRGRKKLKKILGKSIRD